MVQLLFCSRGGSQKVFSKFCFGLFEVLFWTIKKNLTTFSCKMSHRACYLIRLNSILLNFNNNIGVYVKKKFAKRDIISEYIGYVEQGTMSEDQEAKFNWATCYFGRFEGTENKEVKAAFTIDGSLKHSKTA